MNNEKPAAVSDICWLYVTTSDAGEAAAIGRALVEEHLVACVNLMPEIRSLYRWEGKVHDEREGLLTAKTTRARLPEVISRIKELHSYQCPCIVALPVSVGFAPFLDWIRTQCAPPLTIEP